METTQTPQTDVKRGRGRPKGSLGKKKLEALQTPQIDNGNKDSQ